MLTKLVWVYHKQHPLTYVIFKSIRAVLRIPSLGAMPLFRRFIVPKVHCSEGSLVRRFVDPKVLWSEGSLIRILALIFQKKISARALHVQIVIKMGIADHIFLFIIIAMVHAIITRPTSTSAICCRTTPVNLS